MKKSITILGLLLLFAGVFQAVAANIGDQFEDAQCKYEVINEDNKEVSVVGISSNYNSSANRSILTIPETVDYDGNTYSVTSIGDRAFYDDMSFLSVVIGNSVQTIGKYAFAANYYLQNIEFGNSVQTIGERAFYCCVLLANIEFGNSVQTIGDRAFERCEYYLKEVVIGNSVQTIGEMAFYDCSALSSVIMGNSVQTIGDSAFSGCPLSSPVIGNSVQTIGDGAFSGCHFSTIEFGTVQTIGDWAFSDCTALSSVIMGNSVQTIGGGAFYNCSALSSVIMGNSVKSIGERAFYGCSALSSVIMGNSVKSIGERAFYGCSALKSIKLGDELSSIGDGAFSNCALDNLEIPLSVSSIGSNAFENNHLSFLKLPKTLDTIGESAFVGNPIERLYVLTGASISGVFTYDNLVEAIFDEDAVTVPNFSGAPVLKDVTLPPLMKSLPDDSFADCPSLQEVLFYNNVESVGNNAFKGCASLKEITLPSSINEIGVAAFMDCVSLEIMKVPENVTAIPAYLFANCEKLEKVYIPERVSSFGENAFQNCVRLRSLIIPEDIKTIPDYMAQGCTSISEILIPNTVTAIGNHAFAGCTSLSNVDLGTEVYEIADYAFDGCDNIKEIHSMALYPPYADMHSFPLEVFKNATITVQEQSLTRYNDQNPWYRFEKYLTVDGPISLSHYNVDMAGNEVFQLGVYGANSEIVWTSSNPTVAYANECGLIVAMGITGSTVITANIDGEKINCNVVVSAQKREAKGIARAAAKDNDYSEPADIIIESIGGNPPMVNARLIPVGSCTVIDWTSSNSDIATVENGFVTVLGNGDVEFGASTENGLGESFDIDTEDINSGTLTGVKEIPSSELLNATNDVYDLTGRLILVNATEEEITQLNPGIYIVNGKKVLVK